jgi:probable HAF family extracellular repeat protein
MTLLPKIGMEAPVAAAEPAPEIIDLGVLPGTIFSSAEKINNRGVIAGVSGFGGIGPIFAVRWDPDGRIMALDHFARANWPTGINDHGDISGIATVSVGTYAVRWDPSGAITVLPHVPGRQGSRTVGIAADATVAGTSFDLYERDLSRRAARWDPDGQVVDLGTLPGGTSSYAVAINTNGEVAGNSTAADGYWHAVRWDRQGRITDLGADTNARYINDSGEVAGYLGGRPVRWDVQGRVTVLAESGGVTGINNQGMTIGGGPLGSAVRWDRDGHVTVLESPPNFPEASAVVINNAGEVAGTAGIPGTAESTAVQWDLQGTVTDLGMLPGHSRSSANAMNDQGTVVGTSWGDGSFSRAVVWRAVVQ